MFKITEHENKGSSFIIQTLEHLAIKKLDFKKQFILV